MAIIFSNTSHFWVEKTSAGFFGPQLIHEKGVALVALVLVLNQIGCLGVKFGPPDQIFNSSIV